MAAVGSAHGGRSTFCDASSTPAENSGYGPGDECLACVLSEALSGVPRQLYGHGSAIFNTGQQLGGAIGTTIFVTVMSAVICAPFITRPQRD